jgi:hypothetical protein
MKKAELQEALYYCERFKREKFGAWEWLGIMPKATLLEYWREYCAMDEQLARVWANNNTIITR